MRAFAIYFTTAEAAWDCASALKQWVPQGYLWRVISYWPDAYRLEAYTA